MTITNVWGGGFALAKGGIIALVGDREGAHIGSTAGPTFVGRPVAAKRFVTGGGVTGVMPGWPGALSSLNLSNWTLPPSKKQLLQPH